MIKTETVYITPEIAEQWLGKNTNNRPIKKHKVLQFSRDISAGAWHLTHQGVAFDVNGVLADGQHRLHAIIHSGTPVNMMVFRGVPPAARTCIDTGSLRSVADNIRIVTGELNAKRLTEAVNIIRALLDGTDSKPGSVSETLKLIETYRPGLEFAVSLPKSRACPAPVRGSLAFAYATDPERVAEFGEKVLGGANLPETSPALALRNLVLDYSHLGSRNRRALALKTLRAVIYHLSGKQVAKGLYATEDSVAWFAKAHGLRDLSGGDSLRNLQRRMNS